MQRKAAAEAAARGAPPSSEQLQSWDELEGEPDAAPINSVARLFAVLASQAIRYHQCCTRLICVNDVFRAMECCGSTDRGKG